MDHVLNGFAGAGSGAGALLAMGLCLSDEGLSLTHGSDDDDDGYGARFSKICLCGLCGMRLSVCKYVVFASNQHLQSRGNPAAHVVVVGLGLTAARYCNDCVAQSVPDPGC